MQVIRHPLVKRDFTALLDHIVEVTDGHFGATSRQPLHRPGGISDWRGR